ncbi:MAG: nucleoside 2-deoxyribosyltransferase [Chloroflexi bacterium]|nr:nucleoside 2-deoxyribosyltransferase [Chloroflexota bacterium]
MKIYFAGPLFTPYVRKFISEQAKILRAHGIDPFVPHEGFNADIQPERVEALVKQGALRRQDIGDPYDPDRVMELVRRGKLSRELLGLPVVTPQIVFERDMVGVTTANAVVALLDGTQVDDGTACEIGIFYGLMRTDPTKKGIIGYVTDNRSLRQAERGFGQNLFTLGVIEEVGRITDDFEAVIAQLKVWDAELKSS